MELRKEKNLLYLEKQEKEYLLDINAGTIVNNKVKKPKPLKHCPLLTENLRIINDINANVVNYLVMYNKNLFLLDKSFLLTLDKLDSLNICLSYNFMKILMNKEITDIKKIIRYANAKREMLNYEKNKLIRVEYQGYYTYYLTEDMLKFFNLDKNNPLITDVATKDVLIKIYDHIVRNEYLYKNKEKQQILTWLFELKKISSLTYVGNFSHWVITLLTMLHDMKKPLENKNFIQIFGDTEPIYKIWKEQNKITLFATNQIKNYNNLFYEDNDFITIIPLTPTEVIEEGNQQHNCVGRNGYIEKVIENEGNLVFIRRKSNINKSYITCYFSKEHGYIEIKKTYNQEIQVTDDCYSFVQNYVQKINLF